MATKRRTKAGRKRGGSGKKARPRAKVRPKRRPKAKARKPARGSKPRSKPKRAKAKPARRAGATPRPVPVAKVAAAAPVDELRAKVARALEQRGYSPPDAGVVDVVTAVAKGYRQGPAEAPAWIRFDVDAALADGWVERYETGDRSPGPDRAMHRSQVRWTVVFNLEQLGVGTTAGDPERDALTSLCLGAWDPATMTHAERDAAASFIVRWYRDGR